MDLRLSGVAGIAVLVAGLVTAQDQKGLPDGTGQENLQRVCATCHDLETVTGTRRTKLGWERMIEDMVGRGAEGSEDDMAAIVAYLTANFGKVNVNTASAQEIEKMLEFTPKEAQAIVEFREKSGKIADFEQLQKVPGLSTDKLQAKRPKIAFSL